MPISRKLRRIYTQLKLVLLTRAIFIVTGTYWGDEGKGKIVDLLCYLYGWAIRFSGGAGAGHTLVTPSFTKFIGHLIPCGIAQRAVCVLARGVFFDLKRFLAELKDAKRKFGNNLPPILIDEQCPVWTPWHGLFEKWLEHSLGKQKIQTTGKAIGQIAGINTLRFGIRVYHLFLTKYQLRMQLGSLYKALKPSFDAMVKAEIVKRKDIPLPKHVALQLLKDAPKIKQYVTDTADVLDYQCEQGTRMLFEAAQAPGLDIYNGTYPFVSSGLSTAAGALVGSALAIMRMAKAKVLMVMKVFPTRVGAGPFPSEFWTRMESEVYALKNPKLFKKTKLRNIFLWKRLELLNSGKATMAEWSQYFQVLGYELGATTGRGRSVGMMDIMWLHYVTRLNRPDWYALTRFDMLSGLELVPVVTGYELDGKRIIPGKMPVTDDLYRVEPIIEWWDCWEEDIYGISDWKKLPYKARQFIWKLENLIGVPIFMIGTGPERDSIIIRPSAAKKKLEAAV